MKLLINSLLYPCPLRLSAIWWYGLSLPKSLRHGRPPIMANSPGRTQPEPWTSSSGRTSLDPDSPGSHPAGSGLPRQWPRRMALDRSRSWHASASAPSLWYSLSFSVSPSLGFPHPLSCCILPPPPWPLEHKHISLASVRRIRPQLPASILCKFVSISVILLISRLKFRWLCIHILIYHCIRTPTSYFCVMDGKDNNVHKASYLILVHAFIFWGIASCSFCTVPIQVRGRD